MTFESRYSKYLKKTPGCWLWEGPAERRSLSSKNKSRGAILYVNGKRVNVVRLLYEEVHGNPPTRRLFNTCGIPTCVNPAHYSYYPPPQFVELDDLIELLRSDISEGRTYNPCRYVDWSEDELQLAAHADPVIKEWLDGGS